jgi:hypothetical protein
MWVIFGVAGVAAGLKCDLINRLDVALRTLEYFVGTVNLVSGIRIVIELHKGPARADMAGFAGPAEVPVMVVVLEVT